MIYFESGVFHSGRRLWGNNDIGYLFTLVVVVGWSLGQEIEKAIGEGKLWDHRTLEIVHIGIPKTERKDGGSL